MPESRPLVSFGVVSGSRYRRNGHVRNRGEGLFLWV